MRAQRALSPILSQFKAVKRGQDWICLACRQNGVRRWNHSFAAQSTAQKPYYVTSPIFYVNAAPHVGHLYTLVLSDILKRWQALLGRKSILCTGTDEHGMKIQRAANQNQRDVRDFCDEMHLPFKDLAGQANIDYDHFIRTSEPQHRQAVQHFWLLLSQRGHIYSKKHEGWYSISDETFYPQSVVGQSMDPRTGRKFTASRETGKEVEWTSETNYHFRMSDFTDRLLAYYKANPNFVVPETRMTNVIDEVSKGLQDLSISRPSSRLTWGIPVPDDDTQTIYVWLDALINYLTKANYPFSSPGQEHIDGWPADCHVIGKDIVRFHCIYWPAFLMALDLPLPRQVLTHAHWTLGREKMSKSAGVTVNPFFAMDRFGTDTMRYFLAIDGGIKDDAMYDNALVQERYRNQLKGAIGNLLSRLVRGKGWNIKESIRAQQSQPERIDSKFQPYFEELPETVSACLAIPDPGAGLEKIAVAIRRINGHLQRTSPWLLTEPADEVPKQACIYSCVEALRICGILFQPFIPEKATELLDALGVAKDARLFENAKWGSDAQYGDIPADYLEGRKQLFPPPKSWF